MGPVEATVSVIANSVEFSGRASRSEYWWFAAVWSLAYIAIIAIQRRSSKFPEIAFIAITALPVMSVSFRRLQDAGFSGWWSVIEVAAIGLISLVLFLSMPSVSDDEDAPVLLPSSTFLASAALFIIASIGCIWHFSLPSEPGPNQYGPNPHEVTS